MEGVADGQRTRLAPLFGPVGADGFDGFGGPGDDGVSGGVEGRDADLILVRGEVGLEFFGGGVEGGHGATGWEAAHEGGPLSHQVTGIRKVEDAGDVSCGDLADGVSDHRVWSYAQRLQQSCHRDLEREQPGLCVGGVVQQIVRPTGEDHVAQGVVQVGVEEVADLVEGLGVDGEAVVEFAPHARALTALATEQEHRVTRTSGRGRWRGADQCAVSLAVGQRGEPGEQLLAVLAHHHGPVLERRTCGEERPADVNGRQVGVSRDAFGQGPGLPAQRRVTAGRQQPRHGATHLVPGRLGWLRRLLQDQVRVGAADAERGDTGPARAVRLGPGGWLGEQAYVPETPVHLRGRRVDVERGGQYAVAHGLHHFDDAGDAGGGLGVSDVGLDGTQQQRPVVGPVLAVRREERLCLDRIAQRGAGAVRLHRVHVGRGKSGVGQRLPDHPLLRRAVRCGEPVARTVLVDGGAAYHREHLVPVASRVRQPLQQHQARALAPHHAIGGVRERLAPGVGRQPALPRELDEGTGRGHDGDATGEGQTALTLAQGLGREVHGHQRRRACRVHRHRRALKPEGVRDAPRDDAADVARGHVPLDVAGRVAGQRQVVL